MKLHIHTLMFLLIAMPAIHAHADTGARVVNYSNTEIIPIRAKVRFSTLIVLPADEEILDFTTGDKDFWIINGTHNLCYLHPAQAGIRTNLNLVTASGHVYSFLLTEISKDAGDADPDFKVFITRDSQQAVTNQPSAPQLVRASDVAAYKSEIAELRDHITQLSKQADEKAEKQIAEYRESYPPGAYASALPQSAEGQPSTDPLKDEERKRKYLSLFSDNVALTYRNSAPNTPEPSGTNPPMRTAQSPDEALSQDQLTSQALAELAHQNELLARAQQAGSGRRGGDSAPSSQAQPALAAAAGSSLHHDSESREDASRAASFAPLNSNTTKKYVLFEGTILETVLINRLDGSFSGPVECLVSGDVYSHDRQHLLIPAGSKVLGQASKVDTFGQARLAVAFHRLIMPDGYPVSLDQFKGLDQEGATALKDKVNNHYAKIFGSSLALGLLGGVAQIGTGSVLNSSATDRMREGFGTGLASAGEQVLDRFLNILPTVTIQEGTRVKIYLSDDLLLPDYHDHNLPPNF